MPCEVHGRRMTDGAEGTGGAELGIHPGSPEAYEAEPEGPTHSPQG